MDKGPSYRFTLNHIVVPDSATGNVPYRDDGGVTMAILGDLASLIPVKECGTLCADLRCHVR